MTPDAIDRRLETLVAGLPAMTPDAAHAARIRARCHAQLARQVQRAQARRHRWKRIVAPALVGSFCLVYFALVLYSAFNPAGIPGV